MRLACDEMLQGLGRWLRAAGHDTFVASAGMDDQALLAVCAAEARVLVTRDRHLAAHSNGVRTVALTSDDADGQAMELKAALGLDWSAAPFTRCMMDNTPLREAGAEEIARMPQDSRNLPGPFLACPSCARVYWPGSHVRRMRARLEAWAAAQPFMRT